MKKSGSLGCCWKINGRNQFFFCFFEEVGKVIIRVKPIFIQRNKYSKVVESNYVQKKL